MTSRRILILGSFAPSLINVRSPLPVRDADSHYGAMLALKMAAESRKPAERRYDAHLSTEILRHAGL